MSGFFTLLRRDLALLLPGGSRGGAILPLVFFLAVAMLYPFAVGPDAPLLAQTGGGVLWIAALLAAILPLDRLVADDLAQGIFDQLALRNIAEETVMASRLVAHWIAFAPLLLAACLPAAALLGLESGTLRLLVLGLLAGTPGLAAIGLIAASLMAGLRAGSALGGLLLLPLAIPILIFGAGSLAQGDATGIALAGAISLALCALAPFAAAASIRAARES